MHKKKFRLAVLPGEGIGPEVVSSGLEVINVLSDLYGFIVEPVHALIGEEALRIYNSPLPAETVEVCESCDAILFGAVNQYGLLEIRKHFDLFANIRPIIKLPYTRPHLDMVIIRELCSGLYFGPGGRARDDNGEYGYHTMKYYDSEIRRIALIALQYASSRKGMLTVAHKENALPFIPWMKIVQEEACSFPGVKVKSMYVDSAAYWMVKDPLMFDVILSDNHMGDILSDIGGALIGSLGMLGSASLNSKGFGLYEPVHGTAPDLAGKGLANPVGALLSVSMMLQEWQLPQASQKIKTGISNVFSEQGITPDMFSVIKGRNVTTSEVTGLVVNEIKRLYTAEQKTGVKTDV